MKLDYILTNNGDHRKKDEATKTPTLHRVPYNGANFVLRTQNQALSGLLERGLKNLHHSDENSNIGAVIIILPNKNACVSLHIGPPLGSQGKIQGRDASLGPEGRNIRTNPNSNRLATIV